MKWLKKKRNAKRRWRWTVISRDLCIQSTVCWINFKCTSVRIYRSHRNFIDVGPQKGELHRKMKAEKTSEIRLPEVSAVHHRLSSKLAKCQRGRLTVAVTWTERKWVFSLAMACQMKNQHKFQWTQSAWLCICLCKLVCVSVAVCRWSFYKRISSACVHRLSDFYLIFLQIEAISELCGKQVANSSSFASNSCIGGR